MSRNKQRLRVLCICFAVAAAMLRMAHGQETQAPVSSSPTLSSSQSGSDSAGAADSAKGSSSEMRSQLRSRMDLHSRAKKQPESQEGEIGKKTEEPKTAQEGESGEQAAGPGPKVLSGAPKTGAATTSASPAAMPAKSMPLPAPAANAVLPETAPAAATGSAIVRHGKAQVSTSGTVEGYEPVLQRKLEYTEPPVDQTYRTITEYGPMQVKEFMYLLHEATKWSIVVSEPAQEVNLQFFLEKQPVEVALQVLKFHKLQYDFDPKTNILSVRTADEWLREKYGDTEMEEFTLAHADCAYVEGLVRPLLSKTGRLLSDAVNSHIYVWDTRDNLDQIKQSITQVDVALEKREFQVQHTGIDHMVAALEGFLSPGGTLMADPRANTISVWDVPYVLQKIEEAVLQLDVPLNKVDFVVKNADVADVETALRALLSPGGHLVADARTGQILVWDQASVLSKMRDLVERIDTPLDSRSFPILHAKAEDLAKSIEPLLSQRGSVVVDPRLNALVISDVPSRVVRMASVVGTLDQELETRSWVVNYADTDFIQEQLDVIVPEGSGRVAVSDDAHKITVTSTTERLNEIEQLVRTWDVKRGQVYIEAFIVEMGDSVQRELGINWSYFTNSDRQPVRISGGSGFSSDSTDNMSVGQLPYGLPAVGPLHLNSSNRLVRSPLQNIAGDTFSNGYGGSNLGVTLNYLETRNLATILSRPSILVQDGQEAIFENATKVPYVSSSSYNDYPGYVPVATQTGSASTAANLSSYYGRNANRIEFLDVGTILSVLPRVTDTGTVLLDIGAEDSTYVDKQVVYEDRKSTVPEKTVRRAETQLRVQSGETVVLGGLRRDRYDHSTQKAPLLGDVPLLGRIFRSPKRNAQNNELLIFLTTSIIDDYTNPETEKLANAMEEAASGTRHLKKSPLGRLMDRISAGKNEVIVAVGQSGRLYSEGHAVTLEDLRTAFYKLHDVPGGRVILRSHPLAPKPAVAAVTEAALEADVKVEEDRSFPVVVPNANQENAAPEEHTPGVSVPGTGVANPLAQEGARVPEYSGAPEPALAVPPLPQEKQDTKIIRHGKPVSEGRKASRESKKKELKSDSNSVAEPEKQSAPAVKPETKPEPKPAPKLESKPEAKLETKPAPEPEKKVVPEATPQAKPSPKPEKETPPSLPGMGVLPAPKK